MERDDAIYRTTAFIVFQPGPPGTSARVSISPSAETVLAFSKDPLGKTLPSRESVVGMCLKWASLLAADGGGRRGAGSESAGLPGLIGIIQSHRRKYDVYGFVLDGRLQGSVTRYSSYLFILERSNSSSAILQKVFREKRLSPREQGLVRLLFSDKSNKEIAHALGLSVNTVKGYLKSLALKMGASTRAGILAEFYKPAPPISGTRPSREEQ